MSESDTLIQTESNQHSCAKCPSHPCLQSKAATLIIVWTVFTGIVYTSFGAAGTVIIAKSHVTDNNVNSVATYPISIVYAVLAIVAVLYPLIGFVADVSCGRFKMVISCFCLVLFSYLAACFCLVVVKILEEDCNNNNVPPAIITIAVIAIFLTFIGFGGYQANFIQLGLDQQLTAPSKDLALFVHWVMWAYNFGCTVIAIVFQPYACLATSSTGRVAIITIPLFLTFFFLLSLFVGCLKHRWFNSDLRGRQANPYKMIIKVLSFAWKHKYPLNRSAFTYSDDEKPNRLDFAKEKFGGPFTTEQVEDTKSFFKISAVLLALGPVFTMDVSSSFMGFMLFGFHVGNIHFANGTTIIADHCSSWTFIWSGSLKYLSGTVLFPLYIWFIFSYLHKRIPRMFARLFAGIILYLLGELCLLFTDLAGHISYANRHPSFGATSMCMFEDIFRSSNAHLELHWAVMLPPSILLGIGPLVIITTALEFISAQSPQFMKGLIVGLFFAIIGLFQLIGALALIPFSLKEIWDTASMRQNPPTVNCGFGYFLFTFSVAFLGLVFFVIVARKYTYRVRDNKPYNQSQVEEIVSRYLERPIHSYS